MIVEYFEECGVLTFAAGASVLSRMEQLLVYLVVHRATAKEDANEEVEIRLEEVDNAETIKFQAIGLLVNHNINNM
jgi:hypothetical protein